MNRQHLAYLYIPKYRCIENGEFHFDPRYEIHYDPKKGTLSINSRNTVPENFWGPHICSVTAIVGENGAGKSTLLRRIVNLLDLMNLDMPYRENELSYIIITIGSGDSQNLKIYVSNDFNNNLKIIFNDKIINEENNNRITLTTSFPSLPYILYRGDFYPQSDSGSWEAEGETSHNISDSCLLFSDYTNNYKSSPFDINPRDLSRAYYIENSLRISGMLIELNSRHHVPKKEDSYGILGNCHLPKLIIINDNRSAEERLTARGLTLHSYPPNASDRDRKTEISPQELSEIFRPKEVSYSSDKKDSRPRGLDRNVVLEAFIESFIWNLLLHNPNGIEEYSKFWQGWLEYPCNEDNLTIDFINYLRNSDETKDPAFESFAHALKTIDRVCIFSDIFGYYLPTIESGRLKELVDRFLTDPINKRIRYFDIRYAHNQSDACTEISDLSTGEYQMLNLLSRIFHICHVKGALLSEMELPALILLDEAETSFHPEWQRQYIDTLISFLSYLKESGNCINSGKNIKPEEDFKFQIIYTTHSPITLSDMPGECVIYLSRKGAERGSNSARSTFGANIFDLYRDSFFMQKGLAGSFAMRKIKEIAEEIEDIPENRLELGLIRRHINLIGDKRIKEYLNQLLHQKTSGKIDELEQLREENDKLKDEIRRLRADRKGGIHD